MSAQNPIQRVPLAKLAEINPSRLTASLLPTDEVSFIPMGDVTESGRWTGSQTRILADVRSGFTCFAEGDVLFAKITPCMENGKGCLAKGLANSVGFGSTEFHVLRAKEDADAGFIYQWTIYQDLRKTAKNSMTGSAGQQRVPTDFFEKFEVLAFPKPEQSKIAEILSTVDRAIEQTEALIAKQQRLKTGLMQDLLTRGIDEHGNLRSEQTHPFKDSPLGRIPVEWEVKPMGQVSTLITNGFVGVATPYYTESSDGVPYLYGNNIRCNRMDMRKLTRITRQFHERQQKSQLNPGDMLTVQSGHIGTTAVVPDELPESNCHALILTKFKKDLLDPNFVSFYCNFCLETGTMGHLFVGSTIKHINTSDFAKFSIPFPSKDEQSEIAKRLLDLNSSIDGSAQGLSKLRALKTALMQDLLTGRKRVTALLDGKEASA
jgi:type I restriction enzyme S subunit